MPRGPGKKSNYNLDYSRFNPVGGDGAEDVVAPSDMPPMQDLLRSMPVELQEAYHLLAMSRANGDLAAERRANELVLAAIRKGGPEVQRDFLKELGKQMPDAAKVLAGTMTSRPAEPASAAEEPDNLSERIDTLRDRMEKGAAATRQQLDRLQKQQEQVESLRGPEDFFKLLKQEGLGDGDLQRILSGDQAHMEKCVQQMLDTASSPGTGVNLDETELAIKAADDLHASICRDEAPAPADPRPPETEPAPAVPSRPVRETRKPEEDAKIPDHRLQYQKDAEDRYVGVELRCTLPGVADMSAIALDISEKHVRLSTCAPGPRYVVNAGPFPVLIEPTAARAKYSKRREELFVSVPAKVDR
mmetsp:Transcript_10483/g.32536  ORF Transcript_10483/g.32536 Transcript_10483/m.32536 type:complete len:359 (+) Transcript_10483:91-1167(+)